MWRNWYTRTLEVRVALRPWEFESPHPHIFHKGVEHLVFDPFAVVTLIC
jgi:hypothetical protein